MHQQGFSVIELLMGLTIAGIVLLLVGPAFATLTESNHREEAAASLVSGMRSARSEAIARNQTVVIHGINDDWGQGWRIILDVSGKGHEDMRTATIHCWSNAGARRGCRFSAIATSGLPSDSAIWVNHCTVAFNRGPCTSAQPTKR